MIDDLPIISRDFAQLAMLASGATGSGSFPCSFRSRFWVHAEETTDGYTEEDDPGMTKCAAPQRRVRRMSDI
jgi:hypothetical protein